MKTISKLLILPLLLCLIFTGCKQESAPVSLSNFFFDTVITITVYDDDKTAANTAIESCFALCEKYENLFSRQIETSDISKINKNSQTPVSIDGDTMNLLITALEFQDITPAFNINMGNISDLWDFTGNPHIPDEKDIQTLLSYVHPGKLQTEIADNSDSEYIYDNGILEINTQEKTATLKVPEVSIDLGGIAKGFVAERLKENLREHGIGNAIVYLGGNVDVMGTKPDGSPFIIGIKNPDESSEEPITVVEGSDISVVTSGNYERYFEKDGVRYHHILDPATGHPADSGLSSVTITGPESVVCDALSTLCFVLGHEKSLDLLQSFPGYEGIFMDETGKIIP